MYAIEWQIRKHTYRIDNVAALFIQVEDKQFVNKFVALCRSVLRFVDVKEGAELTENPEAELEEDLDVVEDHIINYAVEADLDEDLADLLEEYSKLEKENCEACETCETCISEESTPKIASENS